MLKCNYIYRGVHTYHSLRIRVRIGVGVRASFVCLNEKDLVTLAKNFMSAVLSKRKPLSSCSWCDRYIHAFGAIFDPFACSPTHSLTL